eukprot:2373271-Rhodomonas_salina.1
MAGTSHMGVFVCVQCGCVEVGCFRRGSRQPQTNKRTNKRTSIFCQNATRVVELERMVRLVQRRHRCDSEVMFDDTQKSHRSASS